MAMHCDQDSCGQSFDAEGEASSLLQAMRRNAADDEQADRGLISKVDPDDWLRDCAAELYRLPNYSSSNTNYSQYYNINKTSGLCQATIACQFKQCYWTEEATKAILGNDMSTASFDDIKQHLPEANLPAHISFPRSVKDVVWAVRSARKKGRRVTVKTSGHSYPGSSTGAGSLNINLRSFPKYSPASITECADAKAGDGACRLALARRKPAVVRVGASELWDDVYRAVLRWNNESVKSGGKLYDIQGGGAGTVSAIGGWLQGGGLGVGLTRSTGLGVDNVLQLEMVLPCGEHVKFGPVRWRWAPGQQYPQTEAVEGRCNANVHEDERKWRWVPCEHPIPFDRLWRAVRGGGGGTYGVVTAAHYQLLDFKPWNEIVIDYTEWAKIYPVCGSSPEVLAQCGETLDFIFQEFLLNFLYDPGSIGVPEDVSSGCENSGSVFRTPFEIPPPSLPYYRSMWCIGPAADGFLAAWRAYVESHTPDSEVWRTQLVPGMKKVLRVLSRDLNTTYAGWTLLEALYSNQTQYPPGRVADDPNPGVVPEVSGTWSLLVPKQWILDSKREGGGRWPNSSLVYKFVRALRDYSMAVHLLGGKLKASGDGVDAVSCSERGAAWQMSWRTDYSQRQPAPDPPFAELGIGEADLRKAWRPYNVERAWFGDILHGGTEYNHQSVDVVGPLRLDLTTPCPTNFTAAQRRIHCVSVQEAVWGSKLLKELTSTKQVIDPDGLFDCTYCVGNAYYPDGPRAKYY